MDLSRRTPSEPPSAPSTTLEYLAEDDAVLVRDSYARIGPRGAALAIAFFTRLHETIPRLRRYFPFDDKEKRAVAKDLFDLVVDNLGSQIQVRWLLERMGRRGLLDAVTPSETRAVGGCLLAALAELDESWSPEVERAWSRLYDWAASAIVSGAELRRSTR